VTGASSTGALIGDITGGATWGAVIVGAFFGADTLADLTVIDLTLIDLTLFADDFSTPADLFGCPDGRTVADRSWRADCGAGTGATLTVVGFGCTFVITYEFVNSSAGSGLRLVSM
jgi:hypothetical protein